MNIYHVSYTNLINKYKTENLAIFYSIEYGNFYNIYVGASNFLLHTTAHSEDKADFEAHYKSLATEVKDMEEAQGLVATAGIRLRDGKQVVSIFPATEGWGSWFTSAGDQLNPVVRGGGQEIELNWTAEEARGNKSINLQFSEPIEMHDGEACFPGDWSKADKLSMSVVIPANTIIPNESNTGNCNLLYGYVIVPSPGAGAYDIDLATAAPIPTTVNESLWNVDYATGVVTPSYTNQGSYTLLTVEQKVYFIRNISLGSPLGIWDIDTSKVEWIHNNWHLVIGVNKQSAGAGDFSGWILMYRKIRS